MNWLSQTSTITSGSGCILLKDTVNQGSRIALDMSTIGCGQFGLDVISYYDVALDQQEVHKMALYSTCHFKVAKGVWLFDYGNTFPSAALAGTPAATLGMSWDNPCSTRSAVLLSGDIPGYSTVDSRKFS